MVVLFCHHHVLCKASTISAAWPAPHIVWRSHTHTHKAEGLVTAPPDSGASQVVYQFNHMYTKEAVVIRVEWRTGS